MSLNNSVTVPAGSTIDRPIVSRPSQPRQGRHRTRPLGPSDPSASRPQHRSFRAQRAERDPGPHPARADQEQSDSAIDSSRSLCDCGCPRPACHGACRSSAAGADRTGTRALAVGRKASAGSATPCPRWFPWTPARPAPHFCDGSSGECRCFVQGAVSTRPSQARHGARGRTRPSSEGSADVRGMGRCFAAGRPIRVWTAGPAKVTPSPQGRGRGLSPRIGSQ
jgi:hypothetical protein